MSNPNKARYLKDIPVKILRYEIMVQGINVAFRIFEEKLGLK